jgi:hypothetical protein
MREQLSPTTFAGRFDELWVTEAFRLEALPFYKSQVETEPYHRFLSGQPDDLSWRRPWVERIKTASRAGKSLARVHAVQEPLSDYLRFELSLVYPLAALAGEDIRVVDLVQVEHGLVDFWLFDDHVAVMAYSPEGTWLSVELSDDESTVAEYRGRRNALLDLAVPLHVYMQATSDERRPA